MLGARNLSSRLIGVAARARVAATTKNGAVGASVVTRRSAQTVPKVDTAESMQKQAIEQIRARVQYQKEIMARNHEHHNYEKEVDEMYKWIKITILVAVPFCVISSIYSYFDDHHHRHEGAEPDYLRIRTKEFPWECSDCDLLDYPCWKKCRG